MSEKAFVAAMLPAADRWEAFCKANGLHPITDGAEALALSKAHPEAYKANPPRNVVNGQDQSEVSSRKARGPGGEE